MNNTEIVNGLHAIADFIEDYPIVTDSRLMPTIPLRLTIFVATKQQVLDIAELEAGVVRTLSYAPEYTATYITRGLIDLGVVHLAEEPARELARPVDVTEIIAEVEG